MLARTSTARGVLASWRASQVATPALFGAPARGLAENVQELRIRIKATANVAKLTGVMKLVASSKLRSIEMALADAKPFGRALLDSMSLDESAVAEDAEVEGEGASAKTKRLVVVLTTDRGLCGGVNSTLVRAVRSYIADHETEEELTIFPMGEKGRVQLLNDQYEKIVGAVDQCFDKDPVFQLAAALGEKIAAFDYDKLTIFYNEYVNASKYTTTNVTLPQMAGFPAGKLPAKFEGYEIEPDNEETLQSLAEYAIAGSLFYTFLESQASEVSSRVIAMDNATTNATDLADRLTLRANRARQARITSELSEIVAGAESLEEA